MGRVRFITMYFFLHPISTLNHFLARLVTDQIILFLTLLFFLYLSFNYKTPFWQRLDKKFLELPAGGNKNFFKEHAESFAVFGNAISHILLSIILAIVFFLVKHEFSISLSILFTLIFSWGLNRALKLIYKRQRPEKITDSIRKRLSYCFPSGHVMASIAIYFFNAMLLQNLIPFLPWYIIAAFISVCVVTSRIYLNHHFITDVIGGITAGIICLNISIWIYFLLVLGMM